MASPTATGNLLADRYRVLERLGSGGMATVYLAEDERLGRRVAVKRLHAGSPEDTAKRFNREARLGASLNHRNIVTVYDTVTDDESVVIVMEYVDGESLADALRRGPFTGAETVRVLRGVAAALDHAHDHGIVHRDIKPANILLGRNGTVKLVDLGIATAVEGTRITNSGSVMGTAAYMAPEQLDGGDPEPRTDIYALAAVAYEMLAGRPAYRGGTPVEVAHAVVNGPPPDLAEAWPDAPRGVADVLRRGMAFRVDDRPETTCEFVDELARTLEEPPPTSATAALPQPPPEPAQPAPRAVAAAAPAAPPRVRQEPASPVPPARRPPAAPSSRSSRGPLVPLLALLALALIGGALALALLGGGGDGGDSGSSSADSAAERQERAERRRARREREAQQQQTPATPTPTPTPTPAPAPAEPAPAEPEAGTDDGGSDYEIPQPAGSSNQQGANLQLEGHQMLQSGDAEGAITVLERSVEAFPAGTDAIELQYAYFSLGKALREAGRPEDAIPVLELRLKHPNQKSTVQAELDRARTDARQ